MTNGQVVVSNLTKRYGATWAVKGLSFQVHSGRVTGLLGPNGAGKTTTLAMMVGFVAPTSGSAMIDGRAYVELEEPLRHVGVVLETSGVPGGRTGRNHLRVIAAAAGFPDQRVDEVLDLVGLTGAAGEKCRTYSLGMRQRLGIAAALLGDPAVLILDEPANGLDPAGLLWLRDLLTGLASQGRTVLISSHLLSEMQRIADDLVILADGNLVAQGTLDVIARSVGGSSVVSVRTSEPGRLIDALGTQSVSRGADGSLLFADLDPSTVGKAALKAGVVLQELTAERPDLERVFLDLTRGKAAVR